MVIPDDTISSTSTNIDYFDNYLNSFYTDVLESEITGFNISMLFKYKILRLPFINYEFDFMQLFILISILNISLFTFIGKNKLHRFIFIILYYIILFISLIIFFKLYIFKM